MTPPAVPNTPPGPLASAGPVRHADDLSGHAHRQLIGYAGLLLPFLLVIVTAARPTPGLDPWPPLASVSAYYYTGAVAIFIGLLVALSLLLLTYRGYGNEYQRADRTAAVIGGVAAFFVAFFPAAPPAGVAAPAWWTPLTRTLHYVSATTLFIVFIVFSLWLFRKTGKGDVVTADKLRRNRVYLVCGLVMAGAVLWAASSMVTGAPIFIPESIALLAFAVSWLTKGQAHRSVAEAVSTAIPRAAEGR